jgi:hypothetical protein
MTTRLSFHALLAAGLVALAGLAGCGGGGGDQVVTVTPSFGGAAPITTATIAAPAALTGTGVVISAARNVLSVTVDRGVRGTSFNAPFVTVTVCAPGGGNCTQIDHVMVDTGSWGLRLAASALPASLALPQVQTETGAAAECVKFVGGYAWGSVRRADVQLADQHIANLPVHVMADPDPAFTGVPSSCSSAGNDLGTHLDANGILGVGMLRYDCGSRCETSTAPQIYYACTTAAGCAPAKLPIASQVVNPIAALPAHNNGVALALQQVQTGGVGIVSGSLVLGIGTDTNNQLGTASVLAPDTSGNVTVSVKGRSLPAYIDSGTNALLFPDTDMPHCGEFFCPDQPATLDLTFSSGTGTQRTARVTVEAPLANLGRTAAAAVIAAPSENTSLWGLPFFFGRTVFVALKNADTPAGKGPYWAF